MNQPGCDDTWVDVLYGILDIAPFAAIIMLCIVALAVLGAL